MIELDHEISREKFNWWILDHQIGLGLLDCHGYYKRDHSRILLDLLIAAGCLSEGSNVSVGQGDKEMLDKKLRRRI